MQKRFIYALSTTWYASEEANKELYANSIVFIHDEAGKGVEIFAHGSYFKANVDYVLTAAQIESLINDENSNVEVSVVDGKLVFAAKGTTTIDANSEELVQAKAVAGALTSPVELKLNLAEDNKTASFSETFGTLDASGATATATTAVLKAGANVEFSNDNGLVIKGKDWTQEIDNAKSGAIEESNAYTDAEIKKVSDALAGKNVSAEGDEYVNATAADNKVTVVATDKTKASLALADSALQKADITTGSVNGTIAVEGTDVAVAGLKSAAYETKEYFEGYADNAASTVKTELLGDATEAGNTLGKLEDRLEVIEGKDYENKVTDVQVNGASVLTGTVANVVTNTAYNAETNKLATMQDVTTAVAGLSGAMHFIGTSTTDPKTEGATVEGVSTFNAGDVVLFGNSEYVYNGTSWIELGTEGDYAVKGSIKNADIAADAAIDQSKIANLAESLAAAKTTVSKDADSEANYLTITPETAEDGHTNYKVKISGIDSIAEEARKSLKEITKGTDGEFVTTTITEKHVLHGDPTKGFCQDISVAVTTKAVKDATEADNGLATAADVKDYVDNAITEATPETGSVTLGGENGNYVFTATTQGFMTAANVASLMNDAWAWDVL